MKKETLRQDAISKRLLFSKTQDFNVACQDACKNLEKFLSKQFIGQEKSITIGCYSPIKGELDLTEFYKKTNFGLAFPRLLLCKQDYRIEYAKVSSIEDLAASRLSFKEPDKNAEICYPEVIIIPGVLYDKSRNRIGYGRGHFDKFIAKSKKTNYKPIKIGICFDLQLVNEIPTEAHDQNMDVIITESKII